MTIERTSEGIIFKVPNDTNLEDLQDIADLLEFKSIVKKSKATQKDTDALLREVKKGRWEKTKNFLKK